MKNIYRSIFWVCVIFMPMSLIIPASHGLPIDKRLSGTADKWNFVFNSSDHTLLGLNEEKSKQMLLVFLHNHRSSDSPILGHIVSAVLVAMIFSFVGWRREVHLEKAQNAQIVYKKATEFLEG